MKKTDEDGFILIDIIIIILIFGILGVKVVDMLNSNKKFEQLYESENDLNYFNEKLMESIYTGIENKSDIIIEGNNITDVLNELSMQRNSNKEVDFEKYIVKFNKKVKGEFIWELEYEVFSKTSKIKKREVKLYLPIK